MYFSYVPSNARIVFFTVHDSVFENSSTACIFIAMYSFHIRCRASDGPCHLQMKWEIALAI